MQIDWRVCADWRLEGVCRLIGGRVQIDWRLCAD